jgi:hypothetical protein
MFLELRIDELRELHVGLTRAGFYQCPRMAQKCDTVRQFLVNKAIREKTESHSEMERPSIYPRGPE